MADEKLRAGLAKAGRLECWECGRHYREHTEAEFLACEQREAAKPKCPLHGKCDCDVCYEARGVAQERQVSTWPPRKPKVPPELWWLAAALVVWASLMLVHR